MLVSRPLLLSVLVAAIFAVPSTHAAPAQPDAGELASMPLDSLLSMQVSGASKFVSTVADTAAAVTVITHDEIRALGCRTLADVLATVKGVMIANDRTYSYMGVRGYFMPGDYNTRVLLLIDGNRANDVLFDQAFIGTEFPVDLALVERVEFIPGQASAVYGGNALFGVVNVVTRKAIQAESLSGEATLGSFGTRKLRLGSTVALGDALVRWSASSGLSKGEDIRANGAVIPHGDYMRRESLSLNVRWGDFTLSSNSARRSKASVTGPDLVPGDPSGRAIDTESLLNLAWNHTMSSGIDAQVRVYGGNYHYAGQGVYTSVPDALNKDDARAKWWGVEARGTYSAIKDHKLMAGVEYQKTPTLTQRNSDVAQTVTTYLDLRNSSSRAAIFAEDQWRVTSQWTLDATVRADSTQGFKSQVSERVAAMWRPTDRLVTKFIYGTAYRPPTDFESHYVVPGAGGFSPNPDLGMERVRGSEFNIEWTPTAGDSISLSVFRNTASRLIASTYDSSTDLYTFVNQGGVTVQGFEAEWQHGWSNGTRLRANFGSYFARDSNSTMDVDAYTAKHLGNMVLTAPVTGDVTVGAWLRGVSRRGRASGYGLAGLTVSSPERANNWNWSLSVANVFNRHYNDPGSDLEAQPRIEQAGRSIELTIGRGF
jgi:outer membrane receptor protein involved in Fe transport